ncbi:MAG: hypothetical protein RLZZ469_403 [Bacteroidota bacterium]|jgi:hypothetical protein|uniref:hypothetical protein n=1 Tax=Flavobacterium sp. TaxID=239 RepID=UPI0035081E4D
MSKILSFFKDSSPIKLMGISVLIVVLSYFIEKPLPNVFMGLRLVAFVLFLYGVMRLINRK